MSAMQLTIITMKLFDLALWFRSCISK